MLLGRFETGILLFPANEFAVSYFFDGYYQSSCTSGEIKVPNEVDIYVVAAVNVGAIFVVLPFHLLPRDRLLLNNLYIIALSTSVWKAIRGVQQIDQ